MDKSMKKLLDRVFEIVYENLSIEFCEKVNTFAFDENTREWLPDGFTLFIKVSNKTTERWDSSEVERTLYEHLGVKSVVTM